MADALRVALFTVSLGAVVASSLLVVSPLRLGGAGTVLALWVVGCGQVVLLAEGLSLLHALDWPGFLVGHLLILAGVWLWARRWPGGERWRALYDLRAGLARLKLAVWDSSVPAMPLLAGLVLLVGLVSTVQAVWVPPNSVDSLAYRLARVGYYLQFHSLSHFPSDDPRQVEFPVNGELLILWTVAFLRADWLANTVQLLAWVVTTVAVYGLGRQLGLGPRAALFAAGLFALLPQSILQSTSTLNDLLVTSFVVVSLYCLLHASGPLVAKAHGRRAMAHALVLAGAAAGLAVGTKGTALLALPGLAVVFLVLFWRRLDREVLVGALLGGLAATVLGGYIFVQNWLVYGALTGRVLEAQGAEPLWQGFVPNLARTLFQFAFADLSGPLAAAPTGPLANALTHALGSLGEWLFAILGIPAVVEGVDRPWWPRFTFVRMPRVNELYSGVGPIGGLLIALALATLVWPRRLGRGCRPLAFAAVSYLALMSLTLRWSPLGVGRFLLMACALAAPLLGGLLQDSERRRPHAEGGLPALSVRRSAFALVLVFWSGVSGFYVAWLNEDKALPRLVGQDRLGLMSLRFPANEAFLREVDQELSPTSTVGVFGALDAGSGQKDQWEYPFFGPRFTRVLVPLVGPGYVERTGLKAPLPWSNEDLLAAYQPSHVVVKGRRSGAEALPQLASSGCFELPLRHAKPTIQWELWRCQDDDPRSVVENGNFQAWPTGLPRGWAAELAGEARLAVTPVESGAEDEPSRLRLEYLAGGDPEGAGGIVQEVAVGGLRGMVLVADARVRAELEGAAVLWVDDGVAATEVANATTEAETLRVVHRIDPRATELSVHLDASGAGRDAVVLVRTILAIPRDGAAWAALSRRAPAPGDPDVSDD